MSKPFAVTRLVAGAAAACVLAALIAVPFLTPPDASRELRLRAPRAALGVLVVETEPPSHDALLAEDHEAPRNAPLRLAVAAETRIRLLDAPSRVTAGGRAHRVDVRSPGATSVSVAFETFRLPAEAELWLIGATSRLGPFTARDAVLGELWTPAIPGEHLTIELHVGRAPAFEPDVVLTRVHHGYRPIAVATPGGETSRTDDTCHVDAGCNDDAALAGAIRSVAVYTIQGTHTCTGQLVDSATPEPTPYFLTADHCGVTSTNAHTVRIYWNVVSPVCGARCCGDLSVTQAGARLRARYDATDMCLLELVSLPPAAAHAYLSGWDARDGATPTHTTAIHHPRGTEKAISLNVDPVTPSSYLSAAPGDGTHLRVDDWEVGTTEPGSSGSGLWNEAGRLIGQLHGGYAACGSDLSDWYGRLSRSWEGGGSRATRLRDWLDPGGVTGRVRDGRALTDPPGDAPIALVRPGRLLAPAPNPTAGGTRLRWEIEAPGHVEVSLVDVRGRHVAHLAAFDAAPGTFEQDWNGTLPSGALAPAGVYLVRLAHEGRTVSGAKVIVRR